MINLGLKAARARHTEIHLYIPCHQLAHGKLQTERDDRDKLTSENLSLISWDPLPSINPIDPTKRTS